MTQVTPRDIKHSSQAGLASFRQPSLSAPVTPDYNPADHEHVWLPVLTERESRGQNCYTEHRTYKCLCGQEVK